MTSPMTVLGVALIILITLIGIPILWLLVITKRITGNYTEYFYLRSKTTEETLPNGQKVKTTEVHQREKTWWDWQQLLLIPLVLTLLTIGFSVVQNAHSEQLAQDQQQQTTLENYVDQMSDLLLSKNIGVNLYNSKSTDQVRRVARARTLIALSRLDPERKQSVVLFLYQADLITWHHWPNMPGSQFPVVNLTHADLTSADLSTLSLTNADLEWVLLNNANLSGTSLDLSDLNKADLSAADLSTAYLSGTSLYMANLQGANLSAAHLQIYKYNLPLGAYRDTNLSWANLSEANLSEANLSGANLSYANLSGANLSGANLKGADLKGATMPDGSKHR